MSRISPDLDPQARKPMKKPLAQGSLKDLMSAVRPTIHVCARMDSDPRVSPLNIQVSNHKGLLGQGSSARILPLPAIYAYLKGSVNDYKTFWVLESQYWRNECWYSLVNI